MRILRSTQPCTGNASKIVPMEPLVLEPLRFTKRGSNGAPGSGATANFRLQLTRRQAVLQSTAPMEPLVLEAVLVQFAYGRRIFVHANITEQFSQGADC